MPEAETAFFPATVTICGSFRHDPKGLKDVYAQLQAAGATILSPTDIEFVAEEEGFVFAAAELGQSAEAIEEHHLQCMRSCDFVWLHAPEGYVGASAIAELGYAHALGLHVFARELPREAVIANWVQTVDSPAAAVKRARKCSHFESAPTNSVRALQDYYRRVSTRRGWDEETPALILEYLQKELDELKRAMTLTAGGTIVVDGEDPDLELADIVLYAMHLANVRELDLSRSIVEKERINAQRFAV